MTQWGRAITDYLLLQTTERNICVSPPRPLSYQHSAGELTSRCDNVRLDDQRSAAERDEPIWQGAQDRPSVVWIQQVPGAVMALNTWYRVGRYA
jgi:hypothetical protein